jgi:hypothetical protein
MGNGINNSPVMNRSFQDNLFMALAYRFKWGPLNLVLLMRLCQMKKPPKGGFGCFLVARGGIEPGRGCPILVNIYKNQFR